MRKPIPQNEARRLRKRVEELERQEEFRLRAWASEWPGGTNIATVRLADGDARAVKTARMLKHAVVVVFEADSVVRLMALPLATR